ncbi:hypothetical protein EMIHUDRAFT_459593 [Emiliania huxleyi CCMP1516]|uniref:Uncharacterized protein n=2 Tax=Emiliania huxleyi TaxID=2903 RepID=A0A0D3IPN6_EMIH1|nr:hypothetical protein EMIHUDRAFT_459593 [Emiliania huxleyi CCMP1516]EOD13221.1 hypothetical protein EMIHUDRAFT_459593 [Emiliania huxleyi CCMP1516]|eukprot:XP_005765650.1 hypothetical protein EMIHUDRAFT_459593 [Emiliania huxleyi CCMP1516]
MSVLAVGQASALEADRPSWVAVVQALGTLSSQLGALQTAAERSAAISSFYADLNPKLSELGPLGSLAQQRLAMMMRELSLDGGGGEIVLPALSAVKRRRAFPSAEGP